MWVTELLILQDTPSQFSRFNHLLTGRDRKRALRDFYFCGLNVGLCDFFSRWWWSWDSSTSWEPAGWDWSSQWRNTFFKWKAAISRERKRPGLLVRCLRFPHPFILSVWMCASVFVEFHLRCVCVCLCVGDRGRLQAAPRRPCHNLLRVISQYSSDTFMACATVLTGRSWEKVLSGE